MSQLLPFFIIMLAGLLFSEVFRRLHLPLVISLIIAGIIIGPQALDLVAITPIIEFIGRLGLVFLMFLAGLEVKLRSFGRLKGKVLAVALINGAIPFLVGYSMISYLGYNFEVSFLVAIAFMSSSVAVMIPILESKNVIRNDLGKVIVGSIIVQDIISLLLLSLILQNVNPLSNLPTPVFYIIFFVTLLSLRALISLLGQFFLPKDIPKNDDQLFQEEFKLIIVILIGTVVVFELLGLHDIIAGFFAGFILSDFIKSKVTKEKIYAIGYGFFIPIFFILIGSKTNILVFFETTGAIFLTSLIVCTSILSKVISGAIGSVVAGFSKKDSLIIGFSSVPQLFATLAVSFGGFELGIIDDQILTALVALSIVTTFVGPIIVSRLIDKKSKSGDRSVGFENQSAYIE